MLIRWGLPALLATAALAQQLPTRQEIDATMQELAGISGFRVKKQVSFRSIDRAGVRKYFDARMQETIKPKELRAEEITLKKFGFVPADYNLREATAKLITEQAAAFYDYHDQQLFITDWTPAEMRSNALIHELAHALADQNYSIAKYLKRARNDSEKAMAREAVVEGQATLLASEVEFQRKRNQPPPDDKAASQAVEPDYPEFDHAPLYFRETLLFPYVKGSLFQQQVIARDGRKAWREVFEHPPDTTRQILNVHAYFDGDHDRVPPLPAVPRGVHKLKGLVDGTLGALEHHVMLEQFGSGEVADQLAAAWRGCHYRVYQWKETNPLLYSSEWQDEASAQRFFAAYEKVLRGKWKKIDITSRSTTHLTGHGDDGDFDVTIAGTRVTSREGWPAGVLAANARE